MQAPRLYMYHKRTLGSIGKHSSFAVHRSCALWHDLNGSCVQLSPTVYEARSLWVQSHVVSGCPKAR